PPNKQKWIEKRRLRRKNHPPPRNLPRRLIHLNEPLVEEEQHTAAKTFSPPVIILPAIERSRN
ncbi:MAG: hypothetical protein J7L99_02305, partial [Planctomycetes bacterium]|nr:hypothetical protein [Planctomycetota bacterium]